MNIDDMPIPTIQTYQTRLSSASAQHEGGLRTRGEFIKSGTVDAPLVSIITIVRNGDATLERTINSVLSQIYAPIEYIIIDGGSTDETLSIIARHENELAYWRSEPDKGISDAFNKGIALASGDIIGLLNADDWYEPNAVADAVGCLISNNAEIVHGAIQYWEGGRPYVLMGADHEILHHRMSINHPTVFVKRDVYLRHGLFDFDYRFGMDYEWLLRVKKADISFFYIDKRLANMQRGGASDNHWKLAFQELTRAKTTHLGHSYRHTLDYLLLILKGSIRRFADRNELDLLPRIYRKYFGLAKKQRVE